MGRPEGAPGRRARGAEPGVRPGPPPAVGDPLGTPVGPGSAGVGPRLLSGPGPPPPLSPAPCPARTARTVLLGGGGGRRRRRGPARLPPRLGSPLLRLCARPWPPRARPAHARLTPRLALTARPAPPACRLSLPRQRQRLCVFPSSDPGGGGVARPDLGRRGPRAALPPRPPVPADARPSRRPVGVGPLPQARPHAPTRPRHVSIPAPDRPRLRAPGRVAPEASASRAADVHPAGPPQRGWRAPNRDSTTKSPGQINVSTLFGSLWRGPRQPRESRGQCTKRDNRPGSTFFRSVPRPDLWPAAPLNDPSSSSSSTRALFGGRDETHARRRVSPSLETHGRLSGRERGKTEKLRAYSAHLRLQPFVEPQKPHPTRRHTHSHVKNHRSGMGEVEGPPDPDDLHPQTKKGGCISKRNLEPKVGTSERTLCEDVQLRIRRGTHIPLFQNCLFSRTPDVKGLTTSTGTYLRSLRTGTLRERN